MKVIANAIMATGFQLSAMIVAVNVIEDKTMLGLLAVILLVCFSIFGYAMTRAEKEEAHKTG